jgi:hypothetical protein
MPARSVQATASGSVGRVLAVLLLVSVLSACDDGIPGSEEGSTIDRQQFVAAMVGLRAAAVRSPSGRVNAAQRDEILAEHGLDEEDLMRYVEVHGTNVPHMTEVWAEIQDILAEWLGVDTSELELELDEDPEEAMEPLP